MTRVLPLPAPARISTGPSVVSTASRCCGLSWSRKDNAEVTPEALIEFYRGLDAAGRRSAISHCCFPIAEVTGLNKRLPSAPFALAYLARANLAQELPGINAEVVTIIPFEPDGVFTHRFSRNWLGSS